MSIADHLSDWIRAWARCSDVHTVPEQPCSTKLGGVAAGGLLPGVGPGRHAWWPLAPCKARLCYRRLRAAKRPR
jgi:hypothetical protein